MEIVTKIAPIALALIMLGLGLGLSINDFTRVIKNPKDFYAAELIEKSGCKDLRIGDAHVSEIHSNFLINDNNASAKQIEDLGKLIIEKVYNKFQISLEWEIIIIGDNN